MRAVRTHGKGEPITSITSITSIIQLRRTYVFDFGQSSIRIRDGHRFHLNNNKNVDELDQSGHHVRL